MANKPASYNWENPTKKELWGGDGGTEWNYQPNGPITEIIVSHGYFIDAISFKSVDGEGKVHSSDKYGGDGGTKDIVILINWPREYLIKISGTLTTCRGFPSIGSLCFDTNLKKCGPFGHTNGTPFEFSVKDGVIVGFHGRFGTYVNAIGVYIKHSAELFRPSISQLQIVNPKVNTEMKMQIDRPQKIGPWGGHTGKPWDDGAFLAINQIDVHVRNGIVLGVQLQYQNTDGQSIESKRHGGGSSENGDTLCRINLDSQSEYLVGVMGFYGPIEGNRGFEAVSSVSFYTNKGKYGPFGDEIGRFFSSPGINGKVIGFYGRSGVYLDALGVYIEYS
ncbi:hypothetical protein ACOSQ2_011228 [Xanthoceras sorbifolium]